VAAFLRQHKFTLRGSAGQRLRKTNKWIITNALCTICLPRRLSTELRIGGEMNGG
jgi:hypothetical protein